MEVRLPLLFENLDLCLFRCVPIDTMAKPKVYAFSTAYHPFVGGAEIAIEEVSRRLKDRFDFTIVTARMRRDIPKRELRPEGTVIRLGFGTRFDKWLLPVLVLFRISDFGFLQNKKMFCCGVWIFHKGLSPRSLSSSSTREPLLSLRLNTERTRSGSGEAAVGLSGARFARSYFTLTQLRRSRPIFSRSRANIATEVLRV